MASPKVAPQDILDAYALTDGDRVDACLSQMTTLGLTDQGNPPEKRTCDPGKYEPRRRRSDVRQPDEQGRRCGHGSVMRQVVLSAASILCPVSRP